MGNWRGPRRCGSRGSELSTCCATPHSHAHRAAISRSLFGSVMADLDELRNLGKALAAHWRRKPNWHGRCNLEGVEWKPNIQQEVTDAYPSIPRCPPRFVAHARAEVPAQ